MNNRSIRLIVGILIALVLLSLVFYSNQSRKRRFNWQPVYKEASKEPYGTFVIAQLLSNYFPGKGFEVLKDSIHGRLPAQSASGNYVFIGEALFMDSLDVQTLLKFVENGNTAFISSRTIPHDLMFYVYYEECNENYWDDYAGLEDSTVRLNLDHPNLQAVQHYSFIYKFRNKIRTYNWSHIERDYFCAEEFSLQALGSLNDSLIHFAQVRYGKGTFYLHTVPLAFTNIAMLDSLHLPYANRVFSYLPPGKIYWDEYSKTSEAVGRRRNNAGNRALSEENSLQYVLSQPPLAWAWYLLLSLGLLFLLFRAKRRQRVIPVSVPNTNTSLEFVSTIGRLYFLQNSHKKLAMQKMKLFLNFVRERYHLRGSETEADEEFLTKLAAKSEVSRAFLERIWRQHRNLSKSTENSAEELIQFHYTLEEFYKKCK
jgi:hypothetical protein